MAADGSTASALSDAATGIKIGQRVWKIGDPIHSNVTALANQQLKNRKWSNLLELNMLLPESKE
jgi:hypothetical protein